MQLSGNYDVIHTLMSNIDILINNKLFFQFDIDYDIMNTIRQYGFTLAGGWPLGKDIQMDTMMKGTTWGVTASDKNAF